METDQFPHDSISARPNDDPSTRRLRLLSMLAAGWSAIVAALALWWTLDPGAYPLAGTSGLHGLSALVPAHIAAPILGVLGLAGVLLAALFPRLSPDHPGRRVVLAAGATYAVVFGLLLPDMQLLSLLGYLLALTGPVVLTVLLALGARRNRRNLLFLAVIGLLVGPGLATGALGDPTLHLLRGVGEGLGRVGPRPLYLALLLAGGLLFALLTGAAAGQGAVHRTGADERAAGSRLAHWGRIATWVAAAGPVPYVLMRATWLTPWPVGAPLPLDDLPLSVRMMGLLLGLAALGGSVLTVGLVARWGEVFPAWLPGIGGRPVPVMAAVLPGGLVAAVLCASAISVVMLAAETSWLLLVMIPAPVWGPALALAVHAYGVRRSGTGRSVDARAGAGVR